MGDDDTGAGDAPRDEPDVPSEDELVETIEGYTLTPEEHQRIKDVVNGEELARITGHDRRYLVAGAGGDSAAAERRMRVYRLLDERTDPPAVAFRLEDFDIGPDEMKLWHRVFDVLCGRATHIVAVLEDFDGGYVWELGLVFAPSYREKVWVLKRRYSDPEIERERYDNGMAAAYVESLLTGDRCIEWTEPDEIPDAVAEIP